MEYRKSDLRGILLTTSGAACWGLSGSVGQYLFSVQKMDSHWLVPIRLGAAGIILFIYCLMKFKRDTFLPWKTKESALTMLTYGILGVSCCQFLYFLTIQLSSAAIGTIMQDLAPVFILIISCIAAARKPKIIELATITLAMIGVFFITTNGNLASMSVSPAAIIAGAVSGICVAVYNLLAPKLNHVPVLVIQAWSFLLGGFAGLFIFQIWKYHYIPNAYGILGIAFVVVVGNIMAFGLYISGVQKIGPQKAILYSFAEPITAAIISTLVLGTAFTGFEALGFALIFIMLWLTTVDTRSPRRPIKAKVKQA